MLRHKHDVRQTATMGRVATMGLTATALTALMISSAWAAVVPESLQQALNRSDEVVLAVCTGHSSQWVAGNIETTFDLQIRESLVGTRAAGSALQLTQLGGDSPGPFPISQKITHIPTLRPGEAAVLLLRSRTPEEKASLRQAAPNSRRIDSPVIASVTQGKWTVVMDKKTGALKTLSPSAHLLAPAGRPLGKKGGGVARLYEDLRYEILGLAAARANAVAIQNAKLRKQPDISGGK